MRAVRISKHALIWKKIQEQLACMTCMTHVYMWLYRDMRQLNILHILTGCTVCILTEFEAFSSNSFQFPIWIWLIQEVWISPYSKCWQLTIGKREASCRTFVVHLFLEAPMCLYKVFGLDRRPTLTPPASTFLHLLSLASVSRSVDVWFNITSQVLSHHESWSGCFPLLFFLFFSRSNGRRFFTSGASFRHAQTATTHRSPSAADPSGRRLGRGAGARRQDGETGREKRKRFGSLRMG